jgi:hypothetical protein
VGKQQEACRLADRFVALAEAFIRTFPDRSERYFLASEAHLQVAKNASRTNDRATVECALKRSLDAALKAQTLTPNFEEGQHFVPDRRRRLAALQSPGTSLTTPNRLPK